MLSTGGVFLRLHYCEGNLSSISISGLTKPCECEDESDECCSNKQYYFKVSTEQKSISGVDLNPTFKWIEVLLKNDEFTSPSNHFSYFQGYAKGPPENLKTKPYILFCQMTC